MGIEAFGVSMHFVETNISKKLEGMITEYPHTHIISEKSAQAPNSFFAEYDDGIHFMDFQLMLDEASNKCTLAVRFSLCSYDTIDVIFIDAVNTFLSAFEAQVWLMTSAVKQKNNYLPGDSQWLIAALPDEIVEMRKYWQKLFGPKQGAVRPAESFSFVGAVYNRRL